MDDVPAIAIRAVRDADIAQIAAIYAHHVRHGLASFEEVPPDAAEMARRRAEVAARGLPYLVAAQGERIAGYAYAGPYRARPAYRFTLEDSVYVHPDRVGRGIGRRLLPALIAACEAGWHRQMIAVIGDSANAASIGLHAACGFRQAGVLRAVGFKLGRWVDTVLMQRALGDGDRAAPGA
jgi:L-amino acid N-acyltransferase YncA